MKKENNFYFPGSLPIASTLIPTQDSYKTKSVAEKMFILPWSMVQQNIKKR